MSVIKSVTAGIAACFVLAGPAAAETVTATLGVTATIAPRCSIQLTPVAFGLIDESDETTQATGGLSVSCTRGTDWTASADMGSGTGASLTNRKMSNGSSQMSYSLYTDSARSRVWGDGSGSTAAIGDSSTGGTQSFPIYGEITRNQRAVPAGSYADVVTITVSY